jgi:hypothetical protein
MFRILEALVKEELPLLGKLMWEKLLAAWAKLLAAMYFLWEHLVAFIDWLTVKLKPFNDWLVTRFVSTDPHVRAAALEMGNNIDSALRIDSSHCSNLHYKYLFAHIFHFLSVSI